MHKIDMLISEVQQIVKKRGLRIQDVEGDSISLDVANLCNLVVSMDNRIKTLEQEKCLKVIGSEKLFDDISFYRNKVFYRDYQLKKMNKLLKRVISFSKKIAKLIVGKAKKKKALSYLAKEAEINKYIVALTKEDKKLA